MKRATPAGQLSAMIRGAIACETLAKFLHDDNKSRYWAKEAKDIRATIEATKKALQTT